jgi:hypothetical protein
MNYKEKNNHGVDVNDELNEYTMNLLIEKMARMTIEDNAAEAPVEVPTEAPTEAPAEVIVLNGYYIVCG